ncbi:dihydrofolate reductase family protein [Yoonia sp. SDW83-1]|uniref:dihydrofolate reductase family protein n=1 Tax=Yoonia sp. SDW83-1 TaxID=3366945 RepID=UPI00398C575C
MQPLIYDVAVSADGFIAGASGDVSLFPHDGPVVADYQARLQTYAAVVMGRTTYEFGYDFGLVPGQNPYPWAQTLVVSKTIDLPADAAVEKVFHDPLTRIDQLREMAAGPVYLCGGGLLAGWLFHQRRITHLRLKRAPILLGQGVTLFDGHGMAQTMTLTDHKVYDSGVIYCEYTL